MTKWTITVDGEHQGPFIEAELQAMLEAGRIGAETPAWTAGMADFEPLRNCLPGILPKPKPSGTRGGWLVKSGDQILGPMSGQEARTLVRIKAVGRDALVRRESEQAWRPLFGDAMEADPAAQDNTYAIVEDAPRSRVLERPPAATSAEPEAQPKRRVPAKRSILAATAVIVGACVIIGLLSSVDSRSAGDETDAITPTTGTNARTAAPAAEPSDDRSSRPAFTGLDDILARFEAATFRYALASENPTCAGLSVVYRDLIRICEEILNHPNLDEAWAVDDWRRLAEIWVSGGMRMVAASKEHMVRVAAVEAGCGSLRDKLEHLDTFDRACSKMNAAIGRRERSSMRATDFEKAAQDNPEAFNKMREVLQRRNKR